PDGYALGDAHDQLDARVHRLEYRVRGTGGRYVDHARRRAGLAYRVAHGVEHRQSQMFLSAASRSDAADEFRAVGERLLGVEGPRLAGEPLAVDAGMAVDQTAHAFALAGATPLRAASVRSSAGVIARPLPASMVRAWSALVPSSRAPTGTLTPTFFTAVI